MGLYLIDVNLSLDIEILWRNHGLLVVDCIALNGLILDFYWSCGRTVLLIDIFRSRQVRVSVYVHQRFDFIHIGKVRYSRPVIFLLARLLTRKQLSAYRPLAGQLMAPLHSFGYALGFAVLWRRFISQVHLLVLLYLQDIAKFKGRLLQAYSRISVGHTLSILPVEEFLTARTLSVLCQLVLPGHALLFRVEQFRDVHDLVF